MKLQDTELGRRILSKGYSLTGFAREILGKELSTFRIAVKKETLRVSEIRKILKSLDCRFEDLFGEE